MDLKFKENKPLSVGFKGKDSFKVTFNKDGVINFKGKDEGVRDYISFKINKKIRVSFDDFAYKYIRGCINKVINTLVDDTNSDFFYYGVEYDNLSTRILKVSVDDPNIRFIFSGQNFIENWENRIGLIYEEE